jgi:two-component system NtrC family sensor kinase
VRGSGQKLAGAGRFIWYLALRMSPAKKPLLSSAAFRIGAAFVAVLLLFGVSLVVTLKAFEELAAAERNVSALNEARHVGHVTASLVREEYIHQAHTIIERDRSHLDHYKDAARAAGATAARLLQMPLAADERPLALDVRRLVTAIDAQFHERILPAVDVQDAERVHELHEHTEELVNEVVRANEELNRRLERRAMRAVQLEARLRQRTVRYVLGCFVLAILVTAGAWFLIGQSLLRRISELRDGALRLAGGDLQTRLAVRGSDELAELGNTFNEMATSLQSHQTKLVRSERLATLGQVSAGVAHEINNPLGVILGYLKLLRRNHTGGGEAADQLRIVEDEARQCQRIVQGLLDLGRPGLSQRTRVNLVDTAREAVERLSEAGRVGSRSILLPESNFSAETTGDPTALRQVISNLVLNAIEATDETGSIALRVRRENGWLELEVQDDGPGVEPDVLEKVFDPFYTTKPTGLGLGLAVSQAIVGAHEGALELESERGKGTRARLRLPIDIRVGARL